MILIQKSVSKIKKNESFVCLAPSEKHALAFLMTLPDDFALETQKSHLMSAKQKLNPLFFAPFVSSVLRVEPDWIDENGHLNMAYYNVLFERAIDQAFELLGLNMSYYTQSGGTIFIGEAHLRYRREVHLETPVRITVQLVDYDAKRIHLYLEMRHSTEGWLAATSELMALHIDKTERKVAPFPSDILDAIAVMQSAHSALPRPEGLGRAMGVPGKGREGKVGLH